MKEDQNIQKWLNNDLTSKEKAEWQKTDTGKKMLRLDRALQAFKAPELDKDTVWESIEKQVSGTHKSNQVWLRPVISIAASIALLIAAYFVFFQSDVTQINTAAAQQKEIKLPDGSVVELNAVSNISYSEKNWEESRTIELDGEAYFDVAKGSTFTVNTPKGTVTVLGTRFNVQARPEYFEVTCFEGSVRVQKNNQKLVLEPMQKVQLMDGALQKTSMVQANGPDWKKGRSEFENASLSFVINELERQYGIKINAKDIDKNQLYTGGFSHEDLEKALQSVFLPFRYQYRINNQTVTITSEEI